MWDDVHPAKVSENEALSEQNAGGSHSFGIVKKLASVETLPKTSFDPSRNGALWPRRVKVSLPSVDLGRMTTVQEACLDSPTIPGRPPLLERSMSVPAVVASHRLSEEPDQLTPRAAEFLKPQAEMGIQEGSHTTGSVAKSAKRSSSMMARELAPLIIPSAIPGNHDEEQHKSTEPSRDPTLPPRVPPKSPRTERRGSPRANRCQHSTHSSVSTSYSTASSATSSSSTLGRASPRLLSETRRTESPLGRSNPMSAVDKSSPDSLWSKLFRLESPSRQQTIDMLEKPNSQIAEVSPTPTSTISIYQKWFSDASAVTRGRLARKDSLAYKSPSTQPAVRSPSTTKRGRDLPSGFKIADVPHQVADVELRGLKRQADEQVSHFEVLQAKDVSMLSKELRDLDDRCEYLQRTYQSLRQGRKSLHERMISYLKSPHMTNFSRESILKQEEALADIDSSIDEWIRKSEQAENRRSRVRQKLLEHVAAALTLRPNASISSRNVPEQHTPPESPEQEDGFSRNDRHRVQSIKIYADAGVAALLAEIEQEIGCLERTAGSPNR
ncbi:MAG: hypothetical protein Q9209_007216 [Squamulea sp. 1 TL-2023]